MHSVLRGALTLSVLIHGVAFAVTPPYAPGGQAPRRCSTSSLTLEVPPWADPLPTGFEASFTATFVGDPRWFGLTSGIIQPRLTPVLAEYPGTNVPLARRDGHRRSFVVGFQRLSGYPPTWSTTPPLREDSACAVVSAVREAAGRALGFSITDGFAHQPKVLVSRSCDALVQDVEATAPSWVTSWSTERVEAVAAQGLKPVDVALIDTGIDPLYQSALGVVAQQGLPSFERTVRPEYHPHGAHMAALIRSVAPNARIRSYRALDGRGMGSLQSVARAVDDALFDPAITSGTRKPLVVNLSVGAPPELAAPSLLTGVRPDGSSCKTWEDGAGETLRYVLAVAGQFEQQQQQGVLVVAASGNSPVEFTVEGTEAPSPALTNCGTAATLPKQGSFFPAAFGENAACVRTAKTWLPVLPVGATTFGDRRSVVNRRDAALQVFAPGERVYAVSPAFPAAGAAVACGASDVGYAHALESPEPVTGTSAAAALTSGAAAQLIGALEWGPVGGGWRAADLARLLYLTGQPLCDYTGTRESGTRIAIKPALHALNNCPTLRSCLRSASHPVGAMVGGTTASVCASAVASCFGTSSPACSSPGFEPGWGTYGDLFVPGATCMLAWEAPEGAVMPSLATFADQQLSGLGPQPSQSGCPNCSLIARPGAFSLRFELSDALTPGTRLEDAYVVLIDERETLREFVPVADGRTWYPGDVGSLKVRPVSVSPDVLYDYLRAGRWKAVFDVGSSPGAGLPARLQSALRVEFR